MGQSECLEFLEQKGDWAKTSEIAEAVGRRRCNVNVPLSGLYRQGDVERRMVIQKEGYEWKAL